MATHLTLDTHDIADTAPARAALPRTGVMALLRRIENGIHARARARRESEVTRFLEANGGKLTDDLEREISRRFGNMVL